MSLDIDRAVTFQFVTMLLQLLMLPALFFMGYAFLMDRRDRKTERARASLIHLYENEDEATKSVWSDDAFEGVPKGRTRCLLKVDSVDAWPAVVTQEQVRSAEGDSILEYTLAADVWDETVLPGKQCDACFMPSFVRTAHQIL